jgi:carboxyl-terminal processing protease
MLMRTIALLMLASASVAAGTPPPPHVQQVLTRVLAHAESASLYRSRVEWSATRAEVQRLADTAQTIPSLVPALRYLLRSMGDEHARVFHGGRPIAYYFGPHKPHLARFDAELSDQIQSASAFPFRAALVGPGVGYVRIVGLPMGDNTAMAKQIEDAVCGLRTKGARRWIVDLRYNGGGNLNPMAEGIAAILGDGPAGGRTGPTPRDSGTWAIERGDFVNEGYSVRLRNGCSMPAGSKVAVLTSLYTASSGEALAVMFKGRPNTRFFGSKTLGMITVTDWSQIDDSTAMTISVGYYRDRVGRVYDQYVDVDEEVAFLPVAVPGADAGVKRALAWLGR